MATETMRKRIILLFDGTWNDAEFEAADTNIVRLRELIAQALREVDGTKRTSLERGPRLRPGERIVSGGVSRDARENIVLYARGLGTNAIDSIGGGVFGRGLEQNVRRAYRFLSFHYQPGDEVFLFGFSRGAYTARSLVGFVGAAGLLRQSYCTADLEEIAWRFYRTSPSNRLPGTWSYLTPYVHDRTTMQIECVGLFDTVGALGVPLTVYRRLNRRKHEFHSVDLASIVKVNLQALAVDEHRVPFCASVWRLPKFRNIASVTEQVWFPGAHADVGGGYAARGAGPSSQVSLDDLPLDWMLKRIRHHFPKFPVLNAEQQANLFAQAPNLVLAQQHNARRGLFRMYPVALRSICNQATGANRWRREKEVGFDRNELVVGEYVHISVLERLGREVKRGWLARQYRPRNVLAVLDKIERTYAAETAAVLPDPLRVVNWSGEVLQPPAANEQISSLLSQVRSRLRLAAQPCMSA